MSGPGRRWLPVAGPRPQPEPPTVTQACCRISESTFSCAGINELPFKARGFVRSAGPGG
jgi:hypothetical protein